MKEGMDRRSFMAGATAMSLAAANAATGADTATDAAVAKPNILLIVSDQHRIECMGAYGNAQIRTPHMDALAADGVRYNNSFCPYPVCTPSRYSMVSGLYAHEHQGRSNHCTLPPGTATFPGILREAGYHTKAVGKMHYTPTYLDVGFEEMVLSEQNGDGRWDDDYHRELRDRGYFDWNDMEDQLHEYRGHARESYWDTFGALPSNLPPEYHSTAWIGRKALESLDAWKPSGEMLMVSFVKPHHPFDPPAELTGLYDPEKLELLPGWTDTCLEQDAALSKGYFPNEKLTKESLRHVMAYYYATIEQIDTEIGKLIAALKRRNLYEQTLIIYTSDHGEYLGYHHLLLKGNYAYDALVKVPLVVKFPNQRRAGETSDALVNNVDLAPTLLSIAGCAKAEGMRGHDLSADDPGREIVFSDARAGEQLMARTHRGKLIFCPGQETSFYYDLEKDPLELENRYGAPEYEEEVHRLEAAIKEWQGDGASKLPYLDAKAPIIAQPNALPGDGEHRAAMRAYFDAKMKEVQQA